jgi:hypothetical protein
VTLNYSHLPLNTRAVKDWSTWIKGNTATINRPPPAIITRLVKDNARRVGGARLLPMRLELSPAGVNLYFGGASVGVGMGIGIGIGLNIAVSSPPSSVEGNDD